MILSDILQREDHDVYQALALTNLARQYDFLHSIIGAAVEIDFFRLSPTILKALNYHAIACLHGSAGEYRPHNVTVGEYRPPHYMEVPDLMETFIDTVNNHWNQVDAVSLAAFCLWRLNNIHPFVNGNGRTARALCYYVVCVKMGGEPTGDLILPERIRRNRDEYVEILRETDSNLNLSPLRQFLVRLLQEQLSESSRSEA